MVLIKWSHKLIASESNCVLNERQKLGQLLTHHFENYTNRKHVALVNTSCHNL